MSFYSTSQSDSNSVIQQAAGILHVEISHQDKGSNEGRTYTVLNKGTDTKKDLSKNIFGGDNVLGRKEILRATGEKIDQLTTALRGGKLSAEEFKEWTEQLSTLKAFHAILIDSKGIDHSFVVVAKMTSQLMGNGLAFILAPATYTGQMIRSSINQAWVASRDTKHIEKWNKMPAAVMAHRELRQILSGKREGSFIEKYKEMQRHPEKFIVDRLIDDYVEKYILSNLTHKPDEIKAQIASHLKIVFKEGTEALKSKIEEQFPDKNKLPIYIEQFKSLKEEFEVSKRDALSIEQVNRFKADLNSLLKQKDRAWKSIGSDSIKSSTAIIKGEISKGDVENIKFLAEQGLFPRVSKKLINQIIMSKLEESDRQDVLAALFKNAQHPKDQERIIRLLLGTSKSVEASSLRRFMLMASNDVYQGVASRRDLAIQLIRDRYEVLKPKLMQMAHASKAELRELRCLAALTGDQSLIKETIPDGIWAEIIAFLTTKTGEGRKSELSPNGSELLGGQLDRRGKIFLHYLMEGTRFVSSGNSTPADSVTSKPADSVTSKPADSVDSTPADSVTSKPADTVDMFDLCTAVFFATKKALPKIGNPFLAKDHKGIMPANSLNIAMGNRIDEKFSALAKNGVIARLMDGNRPGSMSNLAAYLQEQNVKPSLAMAFWCGMIGKLFGEIVSAHMMLGMPEGHITLGQELLNAIELNAPVYTGFGLGAMMSIPLQRILNEARAHNAGLKLSLSQYDDCEEPVKTGSRRDPERPPLDQIKKLDDPYFGNKYTEGLTTIGGQEYVAIVDPLVTPTTGMGLLYLESRLDRAIRTRDVVALSVLLNGDLKNIQLTQKQIKQLTKIHYFPAELPGMREKIYDLIVAKAPTAAAIERLIDNQLMQGASGIAEVKALISRQIDAIKIELKTKDAGEFFQSPRFRALLAGAVTVGDLDLLEKFEKMINDAKSNGSNFGPIFVPLQNRKGDTLLNLACRSNNVQVLKKVLLLMDQEFVEAGGAIEYSVKRSKQHIISMPSLKEFHVSFSAMGASMSGKRIARSPFELLDGNGHTLLQSNALTYELANRFDTEVAKIDISDPNSLSFKKGLILRKQTEQDYIEKSLLFPLKICAGVPISNAIATATGYAIGAATAPYGGIAAAPTIAGLVSYAMAVSIGTLQFMSMLFISAALLSAGTEAFHTAENFFRGNESRFTALGSIPGELTASLKRLEEIPTLEAQEAADQWFKTYQTAVEASLEAIDVIKSGATDFEYKGKNIRAEVAKITTALEAGTIDNARAYLRMERLISSLDITRTQRVDYTYTFFAQFVKQNPENTNASLALKKNSGSVIDLTPLPA